MLLPAKKLGTQTITDETMISSNYHTLHCYQTITYTKLSNYHRYTGCFTFFINSCLERMWTYKEDILWTLKYHPTSTDPPITSVQHSPPPYTTWWNFVFLTPKTVLQQSTEVLWIMRECFRVLNLCWYMIINKFTFKI